MEEKKEIKKTGQIEAIVGGIILNKDNLMLLARGKRWKNKYIIFGGHIRFGESLEAAALREIKEETGLEVSIEKQIGFGDSIFSEESDPNKHLVFFDLVFRHSGDNEEVNLLEEEYEKDSYVWVDPEGALKMDLAGESAKVIERYLLEKKKEEYLSGWQRCLADFENHKKRQLEERRRSENYIKEDLILQILPVIDNFYSSTLHIPANQKDDPWVVGIMHIQRQLENILKDNGVAEIEVKNGDEFNPEIHESVFASVEGEKKEAKNKDNKVKKVVQRGYKLGDKVIRAAKVIVE